MSAGRGDDLSGFREGVEAGEGDVSLLVGDVCAGVMNVHTHLGTLKRTFVPNRLPTPSQGKCNAGRELDSIYLVGAGWQTAELKYSDGVFGLSRCPTTNDLPVRMEGEIVIHFDSQPPLKMPVK